MKDIDYILNFAIEFGRKLLQSGASLERTTDSIQRICKSYQLKNVTLFALSSYLAISAEDAKGNRASRQLTIEGVGIQLTQLKELNSLSRQICALKPAPTKLMAMLLNTKPKEAYSNEIICLGFVIALTCLGRLFYASWWDVLAVDMVTIELFVAGLWLNKPGVNKIVYNLCSTFGAGILIMLLYYLKIASDVYIIMIVCSFIMLPGIPLVNGVRNILCGNEMNGIIELLKVILETIAIIGGYMLSLRLLGGLPW